ncbi:MAG TPA: sulfite dehydrogenase [Steroidobacteraceae bacterium]|nr:sulfite dehydrogenase [Steroidobacteraceae bacterium]
MRSSDSAPAGDDEVAGGGLLTRRALLGGGIAATGMALAAGGDDRDPVAGTPAWMLRPGSPFSTYGVPSRWAKPVQRIITSMEGFPTVGSSRTPLHQLEGTITPNGLHFERHHNGVPDIDPAMHTLVIHGLVRRPLVFTLDALLRYPMVSRIAFIECGGNSGYNSRSEPPQMNAGRIHGLVSCSEWTGVPLAVLLDEAGVDAAAHWLVAEGADAAAMNRSIPMEKCVDDAIVALYQNGEPLRPEQGYPMRLLLPGFEGNTNVKWLRRLEATTGPVHSRWETAHYTDLMRDGRSQQFVLTLKPKSVILRPSFGLAMQGAGRYEISGLAWSGSGRIKQVEISADGGRSWAEALLDEPVLAQALTRFRLGWQWKGSPAILMSRARDERGHGQPTRAEWVGRFAPGHPYHYNAIQSWQVSASGEVTNVYA